MFPGFEFDQPLLGDGRALEGQPAFLGSLGGPGLEAGVVFGRLLLDFLGPGLPFFDVGLSLSQLRSEFLGGGCRGGRRFQLQA